MQKSEFTWKILLKNSTGVSEEAISEAQDQIGFKLPTDYINLMREFNGGEGGVGENSWLCLFPVEKLIEINKDYELVMQQIPDYFYLGRMRQIRVMRFTSLNKLFTPSD
ncbi:MAG: SMI1/KNR4 family protein [Agriterribacter sp.]